ncbi:MAG: hypothetical protein COB67_11740, partial [SAR324 cluster bacterium]
ENERVEHGATLNEVEADSMALLAIVYGLKKDFNRAIEQEQQYIEALETSKFQERLPDAWLQLSIFLLDSGQVSAAALAVNQAIAKGDGKPNLLLKAKLNQAKIDLKLSRFTQALGTLMKLEKQLPPNSTQEAEFHYLLGLVQLNLSRFQEAIRSFESAAGSFAALQNGMGRMRALMAGANLLMKTGRFDEAAVGLNQVLEDRELPGKGEVYNSLAFLASERGRYEQALDYSQQAEQEFQNQPRQIPEVLNARAIIFLKMKDFEQAQSILLKALKLNRIQGNFTLDAEINNNLGGLFKLTNQLDKARNYLLETAKLQQKLGFDSPLALTFNNIGSVYMAEKRFPEALDFFQRSRQLAEKFKLKNEAAIAWNNLGILYSQQKLRQKAKEAFEQALAFQEELNLGLDMARSYNNLAFIAYQNKDFPQALDLVQQAVWKLSLDPEPKDRNHSNPSQKSILAPDLMTGFLLNKGSFLLELAYGEKTNDPDFTYLEAAYGTFALAIELIEQQRVNIKGEQSQQLLMQSNLDLYQQIIGVLYDLGRLKDREKYHELAFYFSETSRARSFLDRLQEQAAKASLQLPLELQQQEKELKNRIHELSQLIFVELKKPTARQNREQITSWQLKRVDYQLQFKQLTEEIERRFPSFASLKYPKIFDIARVQKELLEADRVALSFFVGENRSFGWVISQGEMNMVALPPAQDLDHWVRKYRDTLINPLLFPDEEDDEVIIDMTQTHLVTGLQIYRGLLQPLLQKTADSTKELIFFPDGVLFYLPFETILTAMHGVDNQKFPQGREYLLHRYSIYYSPSASVLGTIRSQLAQRDPEELAKRIQFGGFGDPQFTPTDEQQPNFTYNPTFQELGFYEMDRLVGTISELRQISKIFEDSNDIFLRANAKESQVKENLSKYRYIHFATHGILDERNPEYSGVMMNLIEADQPEDGFLQSSEIFDLKLNSDLVVLSACETGLGKVVKGEGMVGLTRAFLFAGTPSVVVSLWTVADESTSKMMIYFYQYLGDGLSKLEALRQAKLDLMMEKEDGEWVYPDPFFWGPFILNGVGS